MRKSIASLILLTQASVGISAAPLTELERERLIAHMDMTASWLLDEVSALSPAQLAFRRAPDAWTILEVIDHLVVVGPILQYVKTTEHDLRGHIVERQGCDAYQ